jgi:hypothetical protein
MVHGSLITLFSGAAVCIVLFIIGGEPWLRLWSRLFSRRRKGKK